MRLTYVSLILLAFVGCGGDHTIGSSARKSKSAGSACGSTTCPEGTECCNASCGICVKPGEACILQNCDAPPPSNDSPVIACGSTTCPEGTECCNASCGICVKPGEGCTQQECDGQSTPSPDSPAITCGSTTCPEGT